MSRFRYITLGLAIATGCVACDGGDHSADHSRGRVPATASQGADTMKLTSTAFNDGEAIPRQHTGEGADLSPPLTWTGAPSGTAGFALICDDPDAPTPKPWVHWVIYNLPADCTGLPEGLRRDPQLAQPPGATQGHNSWPSNNIGYRGPMPPPGHGRHRYYFTVYALDASLHLPPRLAKDEVLAKIQPHVLAKAQLLGTYERK